jgi:hypothetical protein
VAGYVESKMRFCSVRLLVALGLGGIGLFSAHPAQSQGSGVAGTWRGESVCVTDAPACHNETVIYYIKDVPDRPDLVLIQADKVVNAKAITMGTGQWQHDRAQHTLKWPTPRQVWLLKIIGSRIEGTLTLADGTVFRRMTLQKNE